MPISVGIAANATSPKLRLKLEGVPAGGGGGGGGGGVLVYCRLYELQPTWGALASCSVNAPPRSICVELE